MEYEAWYQSPLGRIYLTCVDEGLRGLWFEGQRYFAAGTGETRTMEHHPVLLEAAAWLDAYFSGQRPQSHPPLHPSGTAFQLQVWKELLRIPYGASVSYGEIARRMGETSARAVGGAIGRNHISLIVPCHRVVGADGSLTGYAGGTERKAWLLEWERAHGSGRKEAEDIV